MHVLLNKQRAIELYSSVLGFRLKDVLIRYNPKTSSIKYDLVYFD